MIDTILPIPGVPDELLRVLNDRLRQVPGASAPAMKPDPPGVFFVSTKRPDANGTAVGTFGAETDTALLYQVQTVGNKQEWVLITVTPALTYGFAAASGSLTLPATTFSDVPGATYTIPTAGHWLFLAIADFAVAGAGDASAILSCGLNLAGSLQSTRAVFNGASGITATVSQIWVLSAAVGNVAKLQGSKQTGATGTSGLVSGATALFALRLAS